MAAQQTQTDTLRAIRDLIPLDYLIAHDVPGAPGPTDKLDIVGAMRAYSAARWRLIDRVKKAEAERDALLESAQDLEARTRGEGPDVDISVLWDALRAAIAKAVS